MSSQFCPDCHAECARDEVCCPECRFPLKLKITDFGRFQGIAKSEAANWKRILQILRKNGIQIEVVPDKPWASHQSWWFLPGLGVFIFLLTLLMGGPIVDSIWEPVVAPQRMVLLNNEPDISESEVDSSFLENVMKVSDEQIRLAEEHEFSERDYLDKAKVTTDTVFQRSKQSLLEIQFRGKSLRGTLLTADGRMLVDRKFVKDAFQRGSINVVSSGSLTQDNRILMPEVVFAGEAFKTMYLQEGLASDVVLLQTSFTREIDYTPNFDDDIGPGSTVYTVLLVKGKMYQEMAKVVNATKFNDVNLWVLDSELGEKDSGSPVFNRYGELIGVLLHRNQQDVVLSLRRMREKDPLVFKELLGGLE